MEVISLLANYRRSRFRLFFSFCFTYLLFRFAERIGWNLIRMSQTAGKRERRTNEEHLYISLSLPLSLSLSLGRPKRFTL